ncbi:PBSX prophage protein [Peptoniphilus indolicus ATCC 29427]|uniref:PBSX prophage protein n=2 Tax=Peptoniphilus indolicus TaxID=33030 RepID=G4D5F9_9FIRM|nr:PBSX prophage protein [Peptoniphilus indolicus ATCC 29427]
MHINSERIYGNIDGKEALKQMIYKNLNTEYGVHLIYPTFGMPLQDLFGKPKNFVYVELIRRIEECLIKDDRVNSVINFKYLKDKSLRDELSISFTVNSVYGEIEIENTWKFDYDNI